jgi:hypothetical protein
MTRIVIPEGVLRRGNAALARLALLLFAIVSVLALPRAGFADQPGAHTVPVAVLAFDSDDSDEQADAMTGALRSRIRAAQGWSLIETTQSLGMLTAVFKCTSHPSQECQQKIAEQIKAERYIFGFVAKGPISGQVTAEVHLYQKGKPDTVLKESYAENLKDANDDTLRKIAARIVERLGGTAMGVIVVRSSDQTGEVVVDGEKHVPLDKGTARLELAAGGHSVEVAPTGGTSSKRNVIVTAGRDTVVEFTPSASVASAAPPGRSDTRKLIGGASMGAGAVLGTIAVLELVRYFDLQGDGEDRAAKLDKNDTNYGSKPCKDYDAQCNKIDKDSQLASGLAIGLGAASAVALGVGAYLFFSNPGSSEKSAGHTTRVVPSVSASSGSLAVIGSF